jgi:hypothetical protein
VCLGQGEATLFLMPSEMAYTSKLNEVGAVLEKGDIGKYLDYLPLHPETPKVGKRAGQPVENHPLAWDLQQRLVVSEGWLVSGGSVRCNGVKCLWQCCGVCAAWP